MASFCLFPGWGASASIILDQTWKYVSLVSMYRDPLLTVQTYTRQHCIIIIDDDARNQMYLQPEASVQSNREYCSGGA